MKKIIQLYILCLCLFSAIIGQAQVQYDYEHHAVCWDSAGVETTLFGKYFYVVGNPADVVTITFINPVTGTKVVPTIGAVAGGTGAIYGEPCGLIALKNEMTQDPDTCNCLYSIDIDNSVFNTTDNLQQVTWSGESVVTRNCGYGNEEISRTPFVQLQTIKKRVYYNENGGNNLQDGLGFFRQVRWHLTNPDSSILIDLNPSTVLTTYPNITSQFPSFDATDLTFDAANPSDLKNAVEDVIEYALTLYAASSSLSIPNYEAYVVVNANGTFRVGFAVTHNPTGHYAGIDQLAGNAVFEYSSDGTNTVTGSTGKLSSQGLAGVTYQTSCGAISISYFSPIIDNSVNEWKTITLVSPSLTLVLSTTQTCTEACTSIDDGCTTICDTVTVEIAETCLVQQKFGQHFVDATNDRGFAVNSFNSLSMTVLSGTITVVFTNDDGTTTAIPYTSSLSFSLTVDECKLNQTDVFFEGANGTAIIHWKY